MTNDQLEHQDIIEWIRERLDADCDEYERNGAVLSQLYTHKLTLMDVLHALRTATAISGLYEGGCFVVRGMDLDERVISVVVAPPSVKNRVRVVKVWFGD